MKSKNFGWFYAKNGDVKKVVSAPFTEAEFKAEKEKVKSAKVVKMKPAYKDVDPETKYFRNAETCAERFSGDWSG